MHDPDPEDLGIGLEPGAAHYRAYVGPPEDYDLVAAMTFGLLTTLGLRQHHRLLDIGCGSLRVGRLLIPYLNRSGYVGLEPNRWLVESGIARETGQEQITLKGARFVEATTPDAVTGFGPFDFAVAQSIFSHTGLDLIHRWLAAQERLLVASGVLVATFVESEKDHAGTGWTYPECVGYRAETLATLADRYGLRFARLAWRHPRQTWALFARPDFDWRGLDGVEPSWNASVDAGRW